MFGLFLFLRTSLLVEGKFARAAQAQGFRARAWDTFFGAKSLNLCRSAVRSRLKRDATFDEVLAVCLTPPSVATLMRTQSVAVSLFAFVLQNEEFRQLLCKHLHLPCEKHPRDKIFRSRVDTPKYILTCANLDTQCADPLESCWPALIFVTSRSFTTFATVRILLARTQALVRALMAEAHARFPCNNPTLPTRP